MKGLILFSIICTIIPLYLASRYEYPPVRTHIFDFEFMDSVTITVYNAVISQTDSTPLITADNSKIDTNNLQKWVAVSRDVEKKYPMKSWIKISCNGCPYDGEVRQVRDRMKKTHVRRIDILTTVKHGKYAGFITQS